MSNLQKQLDWLSTPFTLTTSINAGRFLKLAYAYGNTTSPDPSTRNGAVLVSPDNKIIVYATNRFAIGIAETLTRLNDRSTKYRMVVHAESGAVFNAARHGKSTKNAILYCPFYACSECAKAIIQGGIERVVGHAQLMALASEHTTWVKSIVDAWGMMHEAGVQCDLYNGTIGVTTRFNGRDIAV